MERITLTPDEFFTYLTEAYLFGIKEQLLKTIVDIPVYSETYVDDYLSKNWDYFRKRFMAHCDNYTSKNG